jgi:hypothetical protein
MGLDAGNCGQIRDVMRIIFTGMLPARILLVVALSVID